MQRVSSRQRLVSWDAFDATADGTSSEASASSYSEYETAIVTLTAEPSISYQSLQSLDSTRTPLDIHTGLAVVKSTDTLASTTSAGRKRVRSISRKFGKSRHSSKTTECKKDLFSFEDLASDVHLYVASFLDLDSIRKLMSVNQAFRRLLLSSDASDLWMAQCQKKWPMMKQVGHSCSLKDSYQLPTAASSSTTAVQHKSTNLALLLSMTHDKLPTEIDQSLTKSPPETTPHRLWRHELTAPPPNLDFYKAHDGTSMICYTGEVGAGDRCVRSNHPFPRPGIQHKLSNLPGLPNNSILDLLCRGAARAVQLSTALSDAQWSPFVAPYRLNEGNAKGGAAWDVTPRLVAYYEVTIHDKNDGNSKKPSNDEDHDDDDEDPLPTPVMFGRPNRSEECVAVGLATKFFRAHSRMPGWDSESFGYHGDDGGIFHRSGTMVTDFGPKFGAGDTVGCGIDYVARGIFFTLNGKFLGYGWKGISMDFLRKDLYPVVGIDTKAPISVNFGAKPFVYDLSGFTSRYQYLIAPRYHFHAPPPTFVVPTSFRQQSGAPVRIPFTP